jgi:hypothetical protein
LGNEPRAVVLEPTISPAEELAENPANERCHEPVSAFVVTYMLTPSSSILIIRRLMAGLDVEKGAVWESSGKSSGESRKA